MEIITTRIRHVFFHVIFLVLHTRIPVISRFYAQTTHMIYMEIVHGIRYPQIVSQVANHQRHQCSLTQSHNPDLIQNHIPVQYLIPILPAPRANRTVYQSHTVNLNHSHVLSRQFQNHKCAHCLSTQTTYWIPTTH